MKEFAFKKDAINFLNKSNNNKLVLFQEDKDTNNSKKFIVATNNEIYTKIKNGKNNYYESWTEHTKLLFGVDIDCKNNIDEKELLTKIICAIQKEALNSYNHTYNNKDFYITKTENSKKLSFHIICQGLVFQNYKACKQLYEVLNKNHKLIGIDDSIYRLTCFRLTYCTKKGKDCILKPYKLKIGKETTAKFINKEDYFINTLITNVPIVEDKYIIKYKKNKTIEKEQNEEFIPSKESKNKMLELMLEKLPFEYCDNYSKWLKVGLACFNDSPSNYEIFDKWSKQSKKYDSTKNKLCWNKFKSDNSTPQITVGSIMYWLKENNVNIKELFSSIKFNVDNYNERPIIITDQINKEVNLKKLNSKLFDEGLKHKLFCIQSEKGTGKTTSLINNLFESNKTPPTSVLFISSRRTFGIKLLGDLKKYGFELYSDIKEQFISVKKIIIQINSLQRLCNIDYEHVIIDEIESLARYITSSHFMRNNNSSIIVSDLEYRIKESVKTIIMDADLSDRTINYCKKAMKLKRNNYYILKNKMMVFNNYTIKYTIYDNWVINILLKIKAKKKLVIPMASNNKAKDLQDLIKIKYPKTKVLLIHKETDDNSKLDILLNINTDWIKYDVVIYTPTVCMGVSFDVKDYFDYIFAYGCHESLGSQEFSQMIHRTRQPKNKTIYLAIDKYNYYNVEEERITREIAEEVICNDYYLSKYDIHNNLIPKKYGKDRILEYPYKDDVLYDLYLRNSIERIEDTNNFTASLFGYLKYKKYQIKYLKIDCEESTKNELKDIANKRKEKELELLIKNILDAENLSEKDYNEKRLRKDEYMDDKTLYALKKFNIKQCYDLDNFNKINNEFIKNYYDKKLMMNYTNLSTILNNNTQTTTNKLNILKNNECVMLDYYNIYDEFKQNNKYTYHYYPFILLKYLGYDINNFDSNTFDIDENIMKQNIEKKYDNLNLVEFINYEINNIAFKFNLRKKTINNEDIKYIIKFVNNIIDKQYGLKIIKKNKKYHLTTNNIWDNLERDEKIIVKNIKSKVKK